ncbi:MAG: hypothetical protein P9M10_06225 [Candidatus Euphemobacter frigidus]|nr:hypothetical protein [Candidatus Euphemobacter frigidus]
MLLFDPVPPDLHWCRVISDEYIEGRCRFDPDWAACLEKQVPDIERVNIVACKLYHGGEKFNQTVSRIDSRSLSRLDDCLGILPEYNDITRKVAKYGLDLPASAENIIVCDTAFFTDIPEWARAYAVPLELRKIGICKYGSNGLGHQWAYKHAAKLLGGNERRIISVFLGNNTNITAVQNGRVLETSSGFTPLEGVLSATGCGQIDPTIIFQLYSAGFSFEEINHILTRESGFTGLRGKYCGFGDLLEKRVDPVIAEIRDIYCYNVLKRIGAFIAVMNGIEAVAFFSNVITEARDLIHDLSRGLEPFGLKLIPGPWNIDGKSLISAEDSHISVIILPYNRWNVMAEEVRDFLR